MVQIVGDGVDGDWLTWRWNDPDRPVGVHRVEGLRESVAAFRAALPREPDSDKGKSPCDLEWLVAFRTVSRQDELKRLGLYGPLTRRDDELELMRALSSMRDRSPSCWIATRGLSLNTSMAKVAEGDARALASNEAVYPSNSCEITLRIVLLPLPASP